MSEAIVIGNIKAYRGEKKTGYLHVGETAVGEIRIPLAIVNGAQPGSTLCISAGVHACEYSSIEAVIRVIRNTDPKKLSGTLLAVPVLNMEGFKTSGPSGGISTAFLCPIDNMNLGRVFPGNPSGSMSHQIAFTFMSKVVSKADYLIDCHGGDLNEEISEVIIIPETGDAEIDKASKEILAASFDCDYIGIGSSGAMGAASNMGKPSIVVESGGYGRLLEDSVLLITKGIENVMKRLKMIEGKPDPAQNQRIRKRWNIFVKCGGICYSLPIGTAVKKGDKVAEVRSIFGELLETLVTPVDGVVIFRRTPIAVKTNDRVVAIVPDEAVLPTLEYSHPSIINYPRAR